MNFRKHDRVRIRATGAEGVVTGTMGGMPWVHVNGDYDKDGRPVIELYPFTEVEKIR